MKQLNLILAVFYAHCTLN